MRLGALSKIGKLGGQVDERQLVSSEDDKPAISVSPKRLWLNVANNNYGETKVTTASIDIQWNAN